MRLRDDTRASAGTGINFLLALVAASIVAYMLRLMVLPFIDMAQADTNSDVALQGLQYSKTVVMYFALVALFTAFFYFITSAINDRRIGA